MATDPRILSSLVKPDMKDDQTRETTLNIEEDLGVLGSDTPETDDERDLAVSSSQDKGRDGGTAPRDTVGGSVRPGSDGSS